MSISARFLYKWVKGPIEGRIDWDAITKDTAVVITAAEWHHPSDDDQIPRVETGLGIPEDPYGGETSPPPSPDPMDEERKKGMFHLGNANIWVTSICPRGGWTPKGNLHGGVDFWVHCDHSKPLDIMVTITALDKVAFEAIVRR